MRRLLHDKLLSLCSVLLLTVWGCDVHEFPSERHDKVPFQLHLDFDTEMPLHKEVVYTRGADSDSKVPSDGHDIRYVVRAYRSDSRDVAASFVFSKSDLSDLDYTALIEIEEGTYDFRVWADYTDSGSTDDKYYATGDFSEVILPDRDSHCGSTDWRDAFRGTVRATVADPSRYAGPDSDAIDNQATVEMLRPMGKYKFVSTDMDVFLTRVARMMQDRGVAIPMSSSSAPSGSKAYYEQLLESIDLREFRVVFRYHSFMNCSFNLFTDKPADSWTGMSFVSRMTADGVSEMTLGYDYIFVNGSETTLSVSVDVYDGDGVLLSSTRPVDVPVVRSRLTVVRGEFLTSEATGGVTISPGYDGDDYNREIL